MNTKNFAVWGVLGLALFISACASQALRSQLVVCDRTLAKEVKKLAIMPFQSANSRSPEYPHISSACFGCRENTPEISLTYSFYKRGKPILKEKYEFIPLEKITEELNKLEFAKGFNQKNFINRGVAQAVDGTNFLNPMESVNLLAHPERMIQGMYGAWGIKGYTIPQAIQVGKNLGADAILLVEYTINQSKPSFSISVRMVHVKTGKVVLAISAQLNRISLSTFRRGWMVDPMTKLAERIARGAP